MQSEVLHQHAVIFMGDEADISHLLLVLVICTASASIGTWAAIRRKALHFKGDWPIFVLFTFGFGLGSFMLTRITTAMLGLDFYYVDDIVLSLLFTYVMVNDRTFRM